MESNAFAEFWRQLPPGGKIHPADKPILDSEQHSLETKSMPAFGAGPLATAPVALCYGRIWRGKRLVRLGREDLYVKDEEAEAANPCFPIPRKPCSYISPAGFYTKLTIEILSDDRIKFVERDRYGNEGRVRWSAAAR